jgi:hypothetical protein
MRFSQHVLLALSVIATCMTLPVRAQSSTDTAPADPARAASEAPATAATTATAPVSATTAASTSPAAPANPTSATSAPNGVATPTAATPQAPATTQAPAASSSTANSTASKISPDVIKRAKDLGLHPQTVKGVTRFCKIDTPLGTHFPTKSCYDEDALPMMLDQIEYERSLMRRGQSCGGGGGCATP